MIPDLSTVLFLSIFFILLSPGLLLSLPPVSRDQCAAQGIADCGIAGGSLQSVDCNKCASIWASQQTSRWTIFFHTLVYFVLTFALLVVLAPKVVLPNERTSTTNQLLPIFGNSFQQNTISQTAFLCALATVLFFALSPGMLITLPPNDVEQCQNTLNIEDCTTNGPNCKRCTSFWVSSYMNTPSVFVHTLAFIIGLLGISYWVRI